MSCHDKININISCFIKAMVTGINEIIFSSRSISIESKHHDSLIQIVSLKTAYYISTVTRYQSSTPCGTEKIMLHAHPMHVYSEVSIIACNGSYFCINVPKTAALVYIPIPISCIKSLSANYLQSDQSN